MLSKLIQGDPKAKRGKKIKDTNRNESCEHLELPQTSNTGWFLTLLMSILMVTEQNTNACLDFNKKITKNKTQEHNPKV